MADRCLDEIDSEIKEVHGRTFRKLGSLLIEIVDRKLFQLKGFTNVEDYFNSEAHLPSARQAFRLISATRFSRQLPDTLPQPKSERQVRPLLGRPIEEAKLLWAITAKIASERKCAVDGKLVSKVVKEYQDGKLEGYAAKVEPLLNGTKSIYDDDNSMEQEEFPQSNPISLSLRAKNEPDSPTLDKAYNKRLPREQHRMQQSPPAQPMPCPIPRSSARIRGQPRSNPTAWCFPCAGHPHSALSQVSSSDNACSCGLGSGNCRVLGMAEQLSSVVSMLAQSWGCGDIPPESDPMDPSTSREPAGSGNPPRKAGKVMCCSRIGYRALHGGGGKIGKVNHSQGQSQEGGGQQQQQQQQQCDIHEEQLFKVLKKSYLQLMMLAQRMGMGMGADQSTGAFHWPYWPQSWPTDPSGASSDWRQWYNLPETAPNDDKDAINMFNGPFSAYMPPPVFSHGMSMSPAPLLPGASNPFGIDSMPGVGDEGGILPSFLQDGFPFPATTPSEGPESPVHYSQDEDDGQIEVGDLLLGSPGPQSLCSGRKRERSTDRSRSQEVSPPVKHGKTVRFSTPEKKKNLKLLQKPLPLPLAAQHRKSNGGIKRTASSRRIDEIMVAEVLVCMSHQ